MTELKPQGEKWLPKRFINQDHSHHCHVVASTDITLQPDGIYISYISEIEKNATIADLEHSYAGAKAEADIFEAENKKLTERNAALVKALETIRDTPISYWVDKKGFVDGEPTNCKEVAIKVLELLRQ